jgi:hypothetical protein
MRAVDSVMEDLEGLSGGCSTASNNSPRRPHRSPATPVSDGPPSRGVGEEEEDDDVSLRVDDLITPVPTRAAYEQEMHEPPCSSMSDQGFEIIDFEKECGIGSFH